MGKKYRFRIIIVALCVWCASCFSVCASSNTDSSNIDGNQIEQGNAQTGTEGTDGTREPIGEENSSAPIGETISEDVGTGQTREPLVQIVPLDKITEGSATQTDIYNALASIHNLLFISFIVFLIVWTYKMITSSYRRFIG